MNPQAKHTPGPWKFFKDTRYGPWDDVNRKQGNPHYYQWWIESDTRKAMALLEVPYLSTTTKHSANTKAEHAETLAEVEANARLIAAAPELLEACEAIDSAYASDGNTKRQKAAFALVRAAISKAVGGAQ